MTLAPFATSRDSVTAGGKHRNWYGVECRVPTRQPVERRRPGRSQWAATKGYGVSGVGLGETLLVTPPGCEPPVGDVPGPLKVVA